MVLTLSSCVVYNTTKRMNSEDGEKMSRICPLHDIRMRKGFTTTTYGIVNTNFIDKDYPFARRKFHMGCTKRGWPIHSLALIYICRKCNKAKRIDN